MDAKITIYYGLNNNIYRLFYIFNFCILTMIIGFYRIIFLNLLK